MTLILRSFLNSFLPFHKKDKDKDAEKDSTQASSARTDLAKIAKAETPPTNTPTISLTTPTNAKTDRSIATATTTISLTDTTTVTTITTTKDIPVITTLPKLPTDASPHPTTLLTTKSPSTPLVPIPSPLRAESSVRTKQHHVVPAVFVALAFALIAMALVGVVLYLLRRLRRLRDLAFKQVNAEMRNWGQ